jgi:hypothetical protein
MNAVALVPGAFKPYHIGHDSLIRIAADENDTVHVYASTNDRGNVSGKAMYIVWKTLIEPTLPGNVTVTYGGSPVGNVIKELGEANERMSTDTFTIYSDPIDLKNNFASIGKYAVGLVSNGQLYLKAIDRSETIDVSGSEMRKYLTNGDKASFVERIPESIGGEIVWNILRSSIK